ncbi:energy-coupling factor transporter ATPase [Anoxybacter fermentans]|uniref:Energy-coupling factor transporter ATPase n=2 Tax=Anoxybacter fermentans TaxID=1323375 RepID=A0A3S9T2J7_9FIRM|nr:energy-coupling factor transporter ATPase [Anoxybacter fermentans]AZR74747.1 energy-coupling factor transporter ATPase [Anoxybacter fermentans]
MSFIQIKDLEYRYSDNMAALKGINLEINEGEFVVIIGSNGSGKSTFAKLLNVLLVPTGGLILVDGLDTRDPDNVWEIRQRVGMVFQNPDNQLVATTVEEDVAFGPENLGIPPEEIRRRVDNALRQVGMDGYQKHAPHHLSGGQKQRVAIAGVIAMFPKCIVLDEPTSMLDPQGRREVMETILHLNRKERKTIIHITHYMEEAIEADRVIVLDRGEIKLMGKPVEVFQEVEKLKSYQLEVPPITELAYELSQSGLDLPKGILTVEELVEALC